MGKLDDKVALISGGARGQGAAAAARFTAEGARVVIGDLLDDRGAETAAACGATYEHLDVADADSWAAVVDATVARHGRLDVLLNNAGILRVGTLEATTPETYMESVRVNQFGTFLGMQAVVPAMRAAGGGSIVNTSSISGMQGRGGVFSYVATKWAVRGMTKAAALELGRFGIRVNSVHPGAIDTEMIRGGDTASVDQDAYYATLPIPRVGRADEVATLVLFLASDDSAYCTGAEFVIDGGVLAGQPVPGLGDNV